MIDFDVWKVFPNFVERPDFDERRSAGVLLRNSLLKMRHTFFPMHYLSCFSRKYVVHCCVDTCKSSFDWELAFIHQQRKLIQDSSQAGLSYIHTNSLGCSKKLLAQALLCYLNTNI